MSKLLFLVGILIIVASIALVAMSIFSEHVSLQCISLGIASASIGVSLLTASDMIRVTRG